MVITMNLRYEAERRVDAKIKFQENLYKYLIVNLIIAIICSVFLQSFWLSLFVIFFWGIEVFDDFFNHILLKILSIPITEKK